MPGLIFYEGPSYIDGKPIVAVATWKTENEKTGPLMQTWMLRADLNPIMAINTGADISICGDCPLRGRIEAGESGARNRGRSCYVAVDNAPGAIYRTLAAGKYPHIDNMKPWQVAEILGSVEGVRYGSYGDPVAVPRRKWLLLEKMNVDESGHERKRPGYTHQWRKKKFRGWATRLMASTHSLEENKLAHSLGFRTFRTINHVSEKALNEIICPASAEGGMRETCSTCGACDGKKSPRDGRHSVAIVAHGSPAKLAGIRKLISLPVLT